MNQHAENTTMPMRPYYRGDNPTWLLDGLIDADSIAAEMRIHRNTFEHKIAADPEFPKSIRLGRFRYYSRSAVQRWLNERLGINTMSKTAPPNDCPLAAKVCGVAPYRARHESRGRAAG